MMAVGKMERSQDMEYWYPVMVIDMKVVGLMMINVDMELIVSRAYEVEYQN